MSKSDNWIASILIFVLVLCAIFLIIFFCRPFNKVMNIREVTATVTEKAVKNENESGLYLVYTEDENGNINTYEISDSLFRMRFDSSDVYAAIKPGNTYKFKIGGSRIKFLSWYPNIYGYELIESQVNTDKLVPIKDKR